MGSSFAHLLETHMATTSKKTKAKRRPPSKAKAKRAAKPLRAASSTVRKGEPGDRPKVPPGPVASPTILNPASAMFEFMSRVTAAYVELPSRLAQCRSPMDFWGEQARFAQRILSECQSATSRGPRSKGDN